MLAQSVLDGYNVCPSLESVRSWEGADGRYVYSHMVRLDLVNRGPWRVVR
jgi:hypothetical protein